MKVINTHGEAKALPADYIESFLSLRVYSISEGVSRVSPISPHNLVSTTTIMIRRSGVIDIDKIKGLIPMASSSGINFGRREVSAVRWVLFHGYSSHMA